MQPVWPTVSLALYFLAFAAAAVALAHYFTRRQGTKPPLEVKFLRGPGESLRQRMAKFNDDLMIILPCAALAPVLAGLATFGVLFWVAPHLRLTLGLWIIAGVFLLVAVPSMRWLLQRVFRHRNDRLGYLGERAVGEALVPLQSAGYFVFHDIPAEGGGHKFNVDHVAVGPGGVFAVETKTRRKGRARPGFEAHKVAYDGTRLVWPWGEDDFGLQNAQSRARWLGEWLNKMTGLGLAPQPVLVFPGWFVVPKGIGAVIVVNHKQVAAAILRQQRGVLTGEQVALIARQLDERCRDVED